MVGDWGGKAVRYDFTTPFNVKPGVVKPEEAKGA